MFNVNEKTRLRASGGPAARMRRLARRGGCESASFARQFRFKLLLFTRVNFALDAQMDSKCSSVQLDANLTRYSRLV